jgi:hypothetical protein
LVSLLIFTLGAQRMGRTQSPAIAHGPKEIAVFFNSGLRPEG